MLMKIKCGNGKFPLLFLFCGKYFGVEIDLNFVRMVCKFYESSKLVKTTTKESVICSVAWKSNKEFGLLPIADLEKAVRLESSILLFFLIIDDNITFLVTISNPKKSRTEIIECAKFRGSRAIVGFVGLVPSCLRGYFMSPKLFLVGISWVKSFFSWVFRESKVFSRGYFVGQNFPSWVIS